MDAYDEAYELLEHRTPPADKIMNAVCKQGLFHNLPPVVEVMLARTYVLTDDFCVQQQSLRLSIDTMLSQSEE